MMNDKRLWIIGIGPGSRRKMTKEADEALRGADVIIGYPVYTNLIKKEYPGKRYLTTPMTQELKRCTMAMEEAEKGKKAAMICSGDAGIYGMASPILATSPQYPEVEITVLPGVTAASSGGAILGAPLSHDFAVISLSDRLTPWGTIEKRLRAAAEGDFSICLYNPGSKTRKDYLKKACMILLEKKRPETVCGIARNIGREGENAVVLTLKELQDMQVDMFSTVFIGNSETKKIGSYMVTPRGYDINE
jgi:precorrin-3B C17-methyltransferase